MSSNRKLSLTKRLQLAYNIVTSGSFNRSNNRPIEHKKSPFMWPFGISGQPQWAMVDYNSYYTDGYSSNAVIYAAIMVKVRAMAQANLVAASGTIDMPDKLENDKHPLALLLDRPNPYQSGNEFTQLQEVYLNLTGNSFTYLERKSNSDLPVHLWPINPVNVQIIPNNKGGIQGYLYNPNGSIGNSSLPILPQDMMHVKFPNPLDQMEGLGFGLSPITPLAKSGDVDNNITDFIKMFFQHGAMPTGVLKLKDLTLDEDTAAEVKEKWMEVYGGSSNWSDIAILDMTMEYQRIGMSFNEMDFSSLDERNESRILLPFGVPAELIPLRLGINGSTFSNKEEARRWFWEDTMSYEMELFLDAYTAFLSTDDGVFPIWDTSRVHALKKDISKQVTAAKELWSIGVPANEAFKTVGLQIANYPGIEIGYLPFSVIPVGNNGKPETPLPPTDNNTDTTDNTDNTQNTGGNSSETNDTSTNQQTDQNKSLKKNWSNDQKAIIYKAFDNIATSHEKPFGLAADKAFEHDKRKIVGIVNAQKKKSLENKASVNFPSIETEIASYLFNDSPVNWRNLFTPIMLTEIEDTGKFWANELGVQFDIRNIEGEDWFTNYTTVFANPITETSNEVVHDVISQAMAEGWSNDTLANTFGDVFDYWIEGDLDKVDFDFLTRPAANPKMGNRLLQWRREMIARTETTRVANAGARNLFSRWGVTKKEWMSTGDERTREWHASMNGQIVDIGSKFVSGLGNKLDYPGDPNAPLNEFIQCRCTILPVIE